MGAVSSRPRVSLVCPQVGQAPRGPTRRRPPFDPARPPRCRPGRPGSMLPGRPLGGVARGSASPALPASVGSGPARGGAVGVGGSCSSGGRWPGSGQLRSAKSGSASGRPARSLPIPLPVAVRLGPGLRRRVGHRRCPRCPRRGWLRRRFPRRPRCLCAVVACKVAVDVVVAGWSSVSGWSGSPGRGVGGWPWVRARAVSGAGRAGCRSGSGPPSVSPPSLIQSAMAWMRVLAAAARAAGSTGRSAGRCRRLRGRVRRVGL